MPALAHPGKPIGGTPPGRPAHWATSKPAWDKTGYYWSHGFKVKIRHNSSTCTSRRVGHQPGTTRNNTMGAVTFNTGWPTAGLPTPPV